MIDTTCPNELLLSGTTSSSYDMEKIKIERPLPIESYTWSDFPINDFATEWDYTSVGNDYSIALPDTPSKDLDSFLSSSRSQSTSSLDSLSISTASTTLASSEKKVRFAPCPKVRTYSIVLGDHPLCEDGLAIELGWDYCDEVPKLQRPVTRTRRNRLCQRRSYLSRKQLLLEVAGCTREELNQRSQEHLVKVFDMVW